MKRFLYSLTFVLLTFTFIPNVKADECDLIYNISSVDFNGGKVSFGGYGLLHDTNNYAPTITISAVDGNGNVIASSTTNGSHGDYSKDYRQDIPSEGNTPDQFDYKDVEFNDLELDLSEAMTCPPGGGGSSGDISFQISVNSNGGSCGTVTDDMLIFDDAISDEDKDMLTGGSIDSALVVTTDARVRENWQKKVEEWYSWTNNGVYDIADLEIEKVGNKFLIGLEYGLGGNSITDGSGKCVPSFDPSGSNPAYVDANGNECTGFAKSNWLQFQGTPASFNVPCDDSPNECNTYQNLGLTCSDGQFGVSSCEETYSDAIQHIENITPACSGGCNNVERVKSASGTIRRYEKGNLSFDLPGETFLSGTGFTFSVSYVNETWYEWISASCPSFSVGYQDSKCCIEECSCATEEDPDCTECCSTPDTCLTKTEYGKSVKYGMTCETEEDAKAIIARVLADRYQGISSSGGSVTFDDGGTSGGWSSSNGSPGESWEEGEIVTSTGSYTLSNAYIHRKTGEIVYGGVENPEDYLSRGQLYYIPLDWPTGTFGVYGQFTNLGVQGMQTTYIWHASYQCGVKNINRWDCWDEDCPGVIDCLDPVYAAAHPDICDPDSLCEDPEYAEAHPEICDDTRDCSDATYREEHPVECANNCDNPEYYYQNKDLCDSKPGESDHSFGFIYRPIDLYDPFPNRLAGYNWKEWYNIAVNKDRLEDSYDVTTTPERLNYSVHLDAANINEIRAYNEYNDIFNRGYLNYSINNEGKSDFFESVSLTPYTNGIQGGNCPLGEFNETCGSVTGK